MNLKKWFYLFITTLLLGGVSAILMGIILERGTLWQSGVANILIGLVWNFGLGATFSIVSQMGFFAYLTIHNVGIGVFKRIWPYIQVLLIVITFVDMIYLRYTLFGEEAGDPILGYILLPLVILLYSCFIAYLKVKQTNRNGAIPTVFVLFVVTIIEWLPALKQNNFSGMIYMLVPLLLCNTWQLMQLHRLTQSNKGAQS